MKRNVKFFLSFWLEPSCVRVSIDMKVLHITDYSWATNRVLVMRSTHKVKLSKADSIIVDQRMNG